MHSKTQRTLTRLERAMRDRIKPFIYSPLSDLDVQAWVVGGEPVAPEIALGLATDPEVHPGYEPFPIGSSWGAPWDTTWFRFSGVAPLEADGAEPLEAVIDLGWADHSVGFQCEGLAYRPDGTVIKALNPKNRWVRVADFAKPGEEFVFYVEAASNPLILGVPAFVPTPHDAKPDVYEGGLYRLRSAQICTYHPEVADLYTDLEVLEGLARVLPEDSVRRERILLAIDRALNAVDSRDVPGTATAARNELASVLEKPANASAHQTSAMGHAHIDSAWLWPTRETERKVARTVANVISLLEANEDFVFTMSSAQQYVWLEERYPELFAKLKKYVEEGRIIPVGGMWVEPDGVLPSGESFARQVLLGQRYFKDRFGRYCDVMWLPDSFGYSGALPQFAKLGGMDQFLTQKISWNDTNTFPHHSFWWEGIDGTRILTHFPPSDTYGAEVTAVELDRAARRYQDKGISDNSILLYGYGDGGGGPTREMLARAKRFENLEEAPQVKQRTPQEFFADLHEELADVDSTWAGELYLELHRGAFTSQSGTKVGNRRNEALIRQAEAAATRAALEGNPYPYEKLEQAWRALLLGQFHDILPGTSINWVHEEAEQTHREVAASLNQVIAEADAATGFVPSSGEAQQGSVSLHLEGTSSIMENQFLKVTVDEDGLVTSIVDKATGRELVPEGKQLGQLALYQDEPAMWDAWDIDKATLDTEQIVEDVESVEGSGDEQEASVRVTRVFGDSRAIVSYVLRTDSPRLDVRLDIDWNEDEKLLKLLFPFDLHTSSAKFETQFGYVERPIHENTSWDAARFEVAAHRYLHLAEPGFGVGLVNDAGYGYSVGKLPGGGLQIGASALKSANFPDRSADRGQHSKTWGIVATPSTAEVLDQAELLNEAGADHLPLVATVEDPTGAVRLAAVKMAEDRSGDVILRLYESQGSRAKATVELADVVKTSQIEVVDLLEDSTDDAAPVVEDGSFQVDLRPFQLLTLRVKPGVVA